MRRSVIESKAISGAKRPAKGWRVALAVFALSLLVACSNSKMPGSQNGATAVSVAVARVHRGSVVARAMGSGEVIALHEVKLTSQIEAAVRAVHADVGDGVRAGQLVIELDCRLSQSDLVEAQAALGRSSAEAVRARRLVDAGLGEERRLEAATAQESIDRARAESLRTRLGFCRFTSPFAGVLTVRTVYAGDLARPGSHLATIADVSKLRLMVPLPEQEAASLQVGAPVDVRVDALGDRRHEAQVSRVWPAAEPGTHRVNVEITLGAAWPAIKPGYMARASFEVRRRDGALLAPRRALLRGAEGDRAEILVVEGDVARKRLVRIGLASPDEVEIVEGLREGDQVVVRGAENLADGVRVRVESTRAETGGAP